MIVAWGIEGGGPINLIQLRFRSRQVGRRKFSTTNPILYPGKKISNLSSNQPAMTRNNPLLHALLASVAPGGADQGMCSNWGSWPTKASVYFSCFYFCSFIMNNLLEESIHLFINITPFNPIICRTLKRRKKKSGISCHHNSKVKESKASHILIPISFFT